jgi:hypothetical protein
MPGGGLRVSFGELLSWVVYLTCYAWLIGAPRVIGSIDVSKRQAAALFLIAPMIAVSTAPPAPPAITCEMIPSTLKLPDCAAAVIAGSNRVTIWRALHRRSNRK